jgi:hypothetical protein
MKIDESLFKPLLVFSPGHPVYAWSRLSLELVKAVKHQFHADVMKQVVESSLLIRFRSFSNTEQSS